METIRRYRIILLLTVVILTALVSVFFFTSSEQMRRLSDQENEIQRNVTYPIINSVVALDGRVLPVTGQAIPLVPKNDTERVAIPSAIWTIKDGYKHIEPKVLSWSSDAKLVYARSYGAISVDGKSSAWQYVFGSENKKSGKEIVIEGEEIVSLKDIPATSFGFTLPSNWYDSSDAIISLQQLPQFSSATLSALVFYSNEDAKQWEYALVTSRGTISMPVK